MSARWGTTAERPPVTLPRPTRPAPRPRRRRPPVVERMSDRTLGALALLLSTGSYAIAQALPW